MTTAPTFQTTRRPETAEDYRVRAAAHRAECEDWRNAYDAAEPGTPLHARAVQCARRADLRAARDEARAEALDARAAAERADRAAERADLLLRLETRMAASPEERAARPVRVIDGVLDAVLAAGTMPPDPEPLAVRHRAEVHAMVTGQPHPHHPEGFCTLATCAHSQALLAEQRPGRLTRTDG